MCAGTFPELVIIRNRQQKQAGVLHENKAFVEPITPGG